MDKEIKKQMLFLCLLSFLISLLLQMTLSPEIDEGVDRYYESKLKVACIESGGDWMNEQQKCNHK